MTEWNIYLVMIVGWCIFFIVAVLLVLYAIKMDWYIWKYFRDVNKNMEVKI